MGLFMVVLVFWLWSITETDNAPKAPKAPKTVDFNWVAWNLASPEVRSKMEPPPAGSRAQLV
jgi:hypothetical protein